MIEMIVVHRRDIDSMRLLLRPALQQAEEQWIPINAVAEALVEELQTLALQLNEPGAAAAYLRALADEIETTQLAAGRTNYT